MNLDDKEAVIYDSEDQMMYAMQLSYNLEEASSLPTIMETKSGHKLVIDLGNIRAYVTTENNLVWSMMIVKGGKTMWKIFD